MMRPSLHAAVLLIVAACVALGGSPEVASVEPTGAQRGGEVECVLRGARLDKPLSILFYKTGITLKSLAAENAQTVRATLVVAPDCELGEHAIRLRTATGVSELRTIFVGALPVVAEVEPNGDFTQPQTVPLNCTVTGVVTSEEVDYFAVRAAKGQRLTVEIEAMRLGRALFDPAVAILDERRFVLASCDDSALLLQDSVASCVTPDDGTYIVEVREASFGGGDGFQYRAHIGTFPRPLVAFPPSLSPAAPRPVSLIGDVLGTMSMNPVLPAMQNPGGRPLAGLFFADDTGASPSQVWLHVSNLPSVVEGANASTAPTDAPAAPIAFDGVIDAPGQADSWRFAASKAQVLDLAIFARRVRSPLDAVAEVLGANGAVLAGNDDAIGPDPQLRFTAPEDGVYVLRVRDHRARGGPTFVYRAEITPPAPALALALERVDARRPQYLQALAFPRANRFAAVVRVDRKDVDGDVMLRFDGLPAGVTAICDPLPAGRSHLPVVFECAPDAPLEGSLVAITGTLKREAGDVVGRFQQVMPLVIGPPNETVYYQTTVDALATAVVEPAPFAVRVEAPSAGILRNGGASLKVIVTRDEGFAGEVVAHVAFHPAGVSTAPNVTIPPGQSEALLPINAAGDAAIGSFRSTLLARSTIDGGETWVASPLFEINVGDVYFGGAVQLAAIAQGAGGAIAIKLEPRRPFEGKARLIVGGLPPKVAATPIEIDSSATEAAIPLTVEADAPVGQHGGLFCELLVNVNGQPLVHRFAGGGAIRIDRPPPPLAAAPAAAPPPPPPPAAPVAKPLSRLEQLRRDAAARAAPATQPAEGNPQ